mmetsp:Transcript_14959/g.21754  ORF Transcript_14959/g.21754 Transcript_14959/m.21754 type:complete len:123 (-) Transcript_14959:735-1103(-)
MKLGLCLLVLSLNLTYQIQTDSEGRQIFATNSVQANSNFLQLSKDSEDSEEGLDDKGRLVTVFVLTFLTCVACCGFVQGVIILSKKLNLHLWSLRSNYFQYKSLLRFKALRMEKAMDYNTLK